MNAARRLGPAAVLVALPSILYAPFLLGGKVFYWGVYLLQFYPWRQLAVEQIQAGHWPLWNPFLGAGTPLAANLQTAAFYPPNVLFLLMPVERAFAWEMALHVALAGLFAYYLGRTLGLSRFGALIAGLAYGGGGYIVARWVFPTMVCAAAWLPLMLTLVEKLQVASCRLQASSRAAYCVLRVASLSAVIALQLLAGHAQTSFYSLLIVGAFALFRLLRQQDTSSKQQARARSSLAACCLLLAACWGVALAAIQLLPTAELAAHSQRAGRLTDLQFAYELSFWPWRLITLLAPDFFGNPARGGYWAYGTYWEEAAFAGVLPLLLAGLAVVAWWRKRKADNQGALSFVPFFLLISLFSILLALGNHTPLYPLLFRYVPGFGLFQAPARLMIGYALAVPLLAGIGADAFQAMWPMPRPTPSRTRTIFRILLLAGLGIGIAGLAALLILPAVRTSFGSSTARLGLTLALAAGLLLAASSKRQEAGRVALFLPLASCLLLLADLLAFGWGLTSGTNPEVYRTPVATAEFLASQPAGRTFVAYPYAKEIYDRYVSLNDLGPSDPAYLQGLRESLLPDLHVPAHLGGVGNYDPLTVGLYHDLWAQLEGEPDAPPAFEAIQPVLNLLSARYVITDNDLPLPLIYDAGPLIYRNDDALPEAFVVSQARVIADQAAQMAALLDPVFDPRAEVLLSRPPDPPSRASSGQGTATSQPAPSILHKGPNEVIIDVVTAQAGYLVLTDTYYPGWHATVDGEPVEILAADHAFRAVRLDAGEHTVTFTYAPFSFHLGAWITVVAILLLLIVLAAGWRRGNRGPEEAAR
jgi:hypothetical protein